MNRERFANLKIGQEVFLFTKESNAYMSCRYYELNKDCPNDYKYNVKDRKGSILISHWDLTTHIAPGRIELKFYHRKNDYIDSIMPKFIFSGLNFVHFINDNTIGELKI